MRKILNVLALLFGVMGLTGIILLGVKPFLGVRLLNYTIFFTLLSFTWFVFTSYFRHTNLVLFFKWSIAAILFIPVIIASLGLIEPNVFEGSWPLLMATIVFQCLIGFLSILGVFDQHKVLTKLDKLVATYGSLFSVCVMIVILLKLSFSVIYSYFYIGLVLFTILFVVSVLSNKKIN